MKKRKKEVKVLKLTNCRIKKKLWRTLVRKYLPIFFLILINYRHYVVVVVVVRERSV